MYFSASNTCFATTFQNTKTKPSFSYKKGSQVAPKTQKIVIDKDATSIKPVQFDEEGFKEYYDVTGIRLNALQKGVNIIKTDKK